MRWTNEQAWNWHAARGWLCGFNYVPGTAVNSTAMWQRESFDAATIERELSWAQNIGFNCCRVFLPYLVWDTDASGFIERLETFLGIAARRGLKTMPILFDDCAFAGREPYLGPQDAPVAGVHNSGWTPSPGRSLVLNEAEWPRLRQYAQSVIAHFANDERVLLWDIYNEPGNDGMNSQSLPLLRAAFDWAREALPSQPLTVGVWSEELNELNAFSCAASDVLSFHDYNNLDATKKQVARLRDFERPLLCTEWMRRGADSHFDTHLAYFKSENIGCFFWGLVRGKTQTYFPWGSPPGAPEPPIWFHDLLDEQGIPHNEREIALIRAQISGR